MPAVALALLPKCPACWPAYAAFASSLGLGFLFESVYLAPLTLLFLILAVVNSGSRKESRPRYAHLAVEVFGASIVLVGKFLLDSRSIAFGGTACLIAGALWSLWPQRPMCDDTCSGHLSGKSITGSHG